MASTAERAFIHIGLQKTGTSFLQSYLWDSPEQLRAAGVRMVPADRAQAFHLMQAVRERRPEGLRPAGTFGSVEDLPKVVAACPEPRLLVSQESLAAASSEQATRLLACFEGREMHVVVTVRDIARQLPSMWQQRVKARADVSFPDFLDQVRAHRGFGAGFWAQQDLPGVLRRWGSGLRPEHVHVVVVPPAGADRGLLAERFGSVVGVDFASLVSSDPRPNVSLDPAQTELVRRVNQLGALGGRSDQARTVKQYFAAQILAPLRAEPARTPKELTQWCREVAQEQIDHVRRGGFSVTGHLEELMPAEEAFGPPVREVDDEELVAVAVPAIAELLARHNDTRRELERLRDENARLRAPATAPRSTAGPRDPLRRLLGRRP